MKKLIHLILFVNLISFQSFSQSVIWNSPITVALGSTYSNIYPRLNLVTGDVPLITWGHIPSASIYSAFLSGATFSTPIKINPVGTTPSVYTWSGAETCSSGDTVIVVFSANGAGIMPIYTVCSFDGGITYQDTVRVDNFIGNDMARFPSIGMGLNGNPVVSFMRMDSIMEYPEWHTARSIDGGSSFLPDVSVSNLNPANVCDCCPSGIATNGNNHITMYRNNNTDIRTIYAAFSTDESATYPIQTEIDTTNWLIAACPSSGPSGVIVGDTLIYTWRSETPSRIFIGTVNINDQQMGQHRLLGPHSVGSQNYPVIVAKGDTIGVVWQETYSGATDVYFTYSTTGVVGLGTNVDTVTKSMLSTQSRPDLAFNNKKFHLSFTDVVGNDVVYMEGTINTIGVLDNKINHEIQLISAYEKNEKIELVINSTFEQIVSIQLIGVNGQVESVQQINIVVGKNSYTVSKNTNSGMKYINLLTKDGKKQGIKLMIVK